MNHELIVNALPLMRDLPNPPRRIILHWTGGAAKANAVDRSRYHFVVENDGLVVLGTHPIAANMRQLRATDPYAAHTGGFNSFSIGLSFAGMLGWTPGGTTRHPLTQVQVESGMRFVAHLCRRYRLDPVNSTHLFTHTEAWTLHKVRGTVNHQKTDITHLPFLPTLKPQDVGPHLRQMAAVALRSIP
jgi:hypothetical protein